MTSAGAERWNPGGPTPGAAADGRGEARVSPMIFLAGGRGRARETRRVPLTSFHNTSAASILDAVVSAAERMPSSYEVQPWRFAIRRGGIDLELDRRGMTTADTSCREAIVRCGTALQQARIALRYWGFADRLMLLPDPDDADLLARLEPGRASAPTMRDERLYATMPERHTPRDARASAAVGARMLAALAHAADTEGARLTPLTSEQLRSAVSLLVEEGDRRGGTAREFRRQLAAWLAPADWTVRLGPSGLAYHLSRLPARLIPASLRAPGRLGDDQPAYAAPLFAMLGTAGDSPRDWLIAGQALQLVLLTARAHGVAASFRISPVQLPRLRAHLAGLVRPGGVPQAIVRLGYTPATLRRLGRAIQITI